MSYRYESLYIMHYGVGHDKGGHSGRYPWGSGDEPYQDLSAAEKRRQFLDKHWYHKGAKIRLGVDHIRDVDPTTKLSDLFKYNKRTTSDVLADKILTFMYGDTEMDREELRRKKYNLMSAITAAEAVAATAIIAKGLGSVKTGYDFITNTQRDMKMLKLKYDSQRWSQGQQAIQAAERYRQNRGAAWDKAMEDVYNYKSGRVNDFYNSRSSNVVLKDVGIIDTKQNGALEFIKNYNPIALTGKGMEMVGESGSNVIENIVDHKTGKAYKGGGGNRF